MGRPEGSQNFKPGPKDELTRGTPNAWGVYTADPQSNTVYLPLGNATPDYYGGNRRPFDEKYSSSVVALDIATGAPKWSFQTTHHDLWDMDLPVGPSLVDLPDGHGGLAPALVQTRGHRAARADERRARRAAVAHPALLHRHAVARASRADGGRDVGRHARGPDDLPHPVPAGRLRGRVHAAAAEDWNGVAIDPERKLLIAMANYIPFVITETPRTKVGPKAVPPWNGQGNEPKIKAGYAPQYGTPYVGGVHPWLNPLRIPCRAPPWGTLTAIDLVSRKVVWQHPFGTTRDSGPFGTHDNLPLPTGIFNIGGGGVTTRSGLYFVGGTADQYLRAVDVGTGRIVWRARLPAGGQANPMTYAVNGKQYGGIAAGGHSGLGTRSGDYVLAYALP